MLLPSGGDETEEKREGCGIWDGPDFSIERAWVRILHELEEAIKELEEEKKDLEDYVNGV